MGIKKDTPLHLVLSAEEVNILLDGLSGMPYKQVVQLISKIHEQVKEQASNLKESQK
jgi:hypothetical protein